MSTRKRIERTRVRRRYGLPMRRLTPIDHLRSTRKFIARVQAEIEERRTLRAAAEVTLRQLDRAIAIDERNIADARLDLKQNRKDVRNYRKRLARAAARRAS